MLQEPRFRNINPLREMANSQKLLWWLIIANIVMFLLFPDPAYNQLVLDPAKVRNGAYWLVLTSLFQHADLMHLLMNMYGLWLFGRYTASMMGWKRFLSLYLASGIAGNLVYMLFFWDTQFYLLGASGAVFGVTLAMAMLFPNAKFGFIFFPVPIKAPTLILIYTALEVFSQVFDSGSGVAHLAHLGGFLGAYIAMKILYRKNIPWDPLGFIFAAPAEQSPQRNFTFHKAASAAPEEDDGSPVSPKEINYLLDKISNSGINSLSPGELKRLRRVRKEMKASR